MMVREGKDRDRALAMTRAAIARVEHEGIRADLERFADGAEVCLGADEIFLALDAVRSIVSTAVVLGPTIGHDVTQEILDGLDQDSKQTAIALQRGLGFTKNSDSKCDIKSGTGAGSSSCVDSKNSVCYTLSSGSGCGSTGSGFQFVWEAAERRQGVIRTQ
jgi:hypothetical protein